MEHLSPVPYMGNADAEDHERGAKAVAAAVLEINTAVETLSDIFRAGVFAVMGHGRNFRVLEIIETSGNASSPHLRVLVKNPKTGRDYWTDSNMLVGPFEYKEDATAYASAAQAHWRETYEN